MSKNKQKVIALAAVALAAALIVLRFVREEEPQTTTEYQNLAELFFSLDARQNEVIWVERLVGNEIGFLPGDEAKACTLFNAKGKRQITFKTKNWNQDYWANTPRATFVTCFNKDLKQMMPEKTVGICGFTGLTPKCPDIDPDVKVEIINKVYDETPRCDSLTGECPPKIDEPFCDQCFQK